MRALHSPTDKSSPGSDTLSLSGNDSSSSSTESTDISLDMTDPSTSFTSSSDDPLTGFPASINLSEDLTEDDALTTLLLEQEKAWEDATTDAGADVQVENSLEPSQPICAT